MPVSSYSQRSQNCVEKIRKYIGTNLVSFIVLFMGWTCGHKAVENRVKKKKRKKKKERPVVFISAFIVKICLKCI